MEVIREGALSQGMRVNERRIPRIAGAVYRRARPRRGAAAILHDVELTTVRPRRRRNAVPQHPERGPQPLPRGQLDTRLHPAWREIHLASSRDLGGRVAARTVVTRQARGSTTGDDQQLPLPAERDILRRGGIVLLLVVAPAAVPRRAAVRRVVTPLRGVDACAGRSIELVAPDLDPPVTRSP